MSGIVGMWCYICQTSSHNHGYCPSWNAGKLAADQLRAESPPPDPALALLQEAREHVCYTSHAPGWKNISASLIARIDAHLKERGDE